MAKKPNLEIEKIKLSINTSSNVLQQCGMSSLDRTEMDRMTLYNCQSLSGFPYDSQAFRKYRHYVLARVEDFSGIFASPGVQDPMTLQGHVSVCNNLDAEILNAESDLFIHALYTNKKLTLSRVSASLESITVSRADGAAIRKGGY
jgi:hypothetical protein